MITYTCIYTVYYRITSLISWADITLLSIVRKEANSHHFICTETYDFLKRTCSPKPKNVWMRCTHLYELANKLKSYELMWDRIGDAGKNKSSLHEKWWQIIYQHFLLLLLLLFMLLLQTLIKHYSNHFTFNSIYLFDPFDLYMRVYIIH